MLFDVSWLDVSWLYKAIYGVVKIGSTLVSYLYILLTCYINLNLIWILTVCCMSLFVVICTALQGFLFCNKVIIQMYKKCSKQCTSYIGRRKGVIRIRISKKTRQHNGEKNKTIKGQRDYIETQNVFSFSQSEITPCIPCTVDLIFF